MCCYKISSPFLHAPFHRWYKGLFIGAGLKIMDLSSSWATVHSSNSSPLPITEPQEAQEALQEILHQPEFQQATSLDIFDQLSQWFYYWIEGLGRSLHKFEYMTELSRLSYSLMWVILLSSLIALSYWGLRFLLIRPVQEEEIQPSFFQGEPSSPPLQNLQQELKQAIAQKKWSQAVMLSWRNFLSQLERQSLVSPDRTQTNWEYFEQLETHSLPPSAPELLFSLIQSYDLHIYGKRPLSSTHYQKWKSNLETVIRLLKLQN